MFRANPNNQIAWMLHENEAFVRFFLRFPRVEDMKTRLSCDSSFEFQQLNVNENEAFVRGFLRIPRGQEVNAFLQCSSYNAQSVSTHAKHNSTASSKKRKSHLEPSVPLRAQFKNISRQSDDPCNCRASEPTFLRKGSSVYPKKHEKTQCFVQILTIKSHGCFMKTKLSCDSSFEFQELKT